jgi:hypothetical protein
MFARRTAEGILEHITGQAAIFAEPTAYVALFTTAPTDDTGTSAVEASGGSYARVSTAAADWNAASTTTDPTTISNANAITFATATAAWGTVVAWGLYDAATAGNLLYWDWLGNYPWQPVTISLASPAVFTVGQAAYTASASVVLDTANRFGGVSPTYSAGAPSANSVLTVVSPTGDTFNLDNGATAINTSAAGSSMVRQITQQSVPSGVQASFAASALVLGAA